MHKRKLRLGFSLQKHIVFAQKKLCFLCENTLFLHERKQIAFFAVGKAHFSHFHRGILFAQNDRLLRRVSVSFSVLWKIDYKIILESVSITFCILIISRLLNNNFKIEISLSWRLQIYLTDVHKSITYIDKYFYKKQCDYTSKKMFLS